MGQKPMPKVVFIADDDPDIRAIVAGAISSLGHIVIEAEDGQQVLEKAKQTEPDLLVLDIMMPNMTGIEVCDHFRKTEAGKFVPILIVTARDNIQDLLEAFDDGVDDYLTKPFVFKELQARVKALLRMRELHLTLQQKNKQLQAMQQKLVEQERQIAVSELAGTAAHQLGQPLSAMLLNLHLLGELDKLDPKFKQILFSFKADLTRMSEMIQNLKSAKSEVKEQYYTGMNILDLENKEK